MCKGTAEEKHQHQPINHFDTKTGQTGISKSSAGKSSPHGRSQHQQIIIKHFEVMYPALPPLQGAGQSGL